MILLKRQKSELEASLKQSALICTFMFMSPNASWRPWWLLGLHSGGSHCQSALHCFLGRVSSISAPCNHFNTKRALKRQISLHHICRISIIKWLFINWHRRGVSKRVLMCNEVSGRWERTWTVTVAPSDTSRLMLNSALVLCYLCSSHLILGHGEWCPGQHAHICALTLKLTVQQHHAARRRHAAHYKGIACSPLYQGGSGSATGPVELWRAQNCHGTGGSRLPPRAAVQTL